VATEGFTDVERYLFDLNGFIVRHGALDPVTVDVVNGACDRLSRPNASTTITSQRFDGLLDDLTLDVLLTHPAAIATAVELCGPTMRLDHAYGIQMQPGTSGLGLHGGGTPHDPSQYYRWQDGHMFNGLVGVMWGLSESRPGDGGFCCIPGSHRSNLDLPDEITMEAGLASGVVIEVPLPPGSMLVFTEALTHGTIPWKGRVDRRTVVYKYSPGFMAWHPPPGYDDSIYGPSHPMGRVQHHHITMRSGIAAALMHPPYIPRHPEVQANKT
jgi:hypothetical protein